MEQSRASSKPRLLSKDVLPLAIIILGFVLLLIVIWLWYESELASLDKQIRQRQENGLPAKSTSK